MRLSGVLAVVAFGGPLSAAADDVTFRSDVSLVRVDVQVRDNGRAVTGLRVTDFELKEEGRPRPIRNFAREEMPVDVLFLFDVSGSMRPHIERVVTAAHSALAVMGREDRVGIMVFDRNTRVRMRFKEGHDEIEREFDDLLRHERFNGGTDIARALYDAVRFISREGRREARRAIVIVTDDRTEFDRDDQGILRELTRADTVLSALIAPDAMGLYSGMPLPIPGGRSPGGGNWPGSSRRGGILFPPTVSFPLPIPGGRVPGGTGRSGGGMPIPGGGTIGGGPNGRLQSAGTREIAEGSGGDSLPVDDASALENTLAGIRQRYALHFLEPPGTRAGQERQIDVQLIAATRRHYPNAELRFRTVYIAQGVAAGTVEPEVPVEVTSTTPSAPTASSPNRPAASTPSEPTLQPSSRRRVAVDESTGSRGPKVSEPMSPNGKSSTTPGGWRKLQSGEKP